MIDSRWSLCARWLKFCRKRKIANRKYLGVADANAVYYYHFDSLGSVVALSDAAGDIAQTYEYSVYGEVAFEDANHPNPYMFAGGRYDIEIGLYYNRTRRFALAQMLLNDSVEVNPGEPTERERIAGVIAYALRASLQRGGFWFEERSAALSILRNLLCARELKQAKRLHFKNESDIFLSIRHGKVVDQI